LGTSIVIRKGLWIQYSKQVNPWMIFNHPLRWGKKRKIIPEIISKGYLRPREIFVTF